MQKQIKSKKRVKEQAEVFTTEREVKAMCDLIPSDVWENIESTFLEPSCGTGNFLVEIFARKLERCKDVKDGLKALNSLFAIDIMSDNVCESRQRLKNMLFEKFPEGNDFSKRFADEILEYHIVCGNALTGLDIEGNKIKFLPDDLYTSLSKKERESLEKYYGKVRC